MESLYAAPPSAQAARNAWGVPAAGPAPAPPASPALRLTERSLSLLRSFKRSFCINTLLSMGFSVDQAAAATDAAAGDAERAAQLAIDGVRAAAPLPANVSRWDGASRGEAACGEGHAEGGGRGRDCGAGVFFWPTLAQYAARAWCDPPGSPAATPALPAAARCRPQ